MAKRKTHEEYIAELVIKNPNVEVLGRYINAKTPILHLCKKHNIEWNMSPTNALQGNGCCECLKEKISEKNGKTHEQFVKELKEVNSSIVVLGTYINANTPILFKCLVDGHEWMGIPSNILLGQGCPKCAGNIKRMHDEYVQEVSKVNPDIEVIGKYINSKTPILHRCKKHNVEWEVAPYNILYGKGCRECGKQKISDKFRKPKERYIEELSIKNPNLEVLGEYINHNTPILHRCLIHDVKWMISPCNALIGHGCLKCKSEKIGSKLKKSNAQYIEELKLVNPNIIVVGEYAGAHIPILHKCKIDGYEWMATPHSILSGNGCSKCSNRIRRTKDDYIADIKIVNSNIELVGDFVNMHTPALHKCLVDNYEWFIKPTNILLGQGCPKCAGNIRKTHSQYLKEVSVVNPNIEVIGEYVNAYTPILHRCKIDGYEWFASPTNILFGKGCPKCHESKGERKIRMWLESNNIQYIHQKPFKDCKDIKPLPFDFYLPDYNLCIEFDGEQHYKPIEYFGGEKRFEYIVKHDNIKSQYCMNNNIELLRIAYFEDVEEKLNNFLFI